MAHVFEDPQQKKVPYDIILGQNFLKGVCIQLDFVPSSSTWLELTIPMRPHGYCNNHLSTFKKELDRLVEIGVLVPTGAPLWAPGTFIIPKRDAPLHQ
jgi:hypothetical protein